MPHPSPSSSVASAAAIPASPLSGYRASTTTTMTSLSPPPRGEGSVLVGRGGCHHRCRSKGIGIPVLILIPPFVAVVIISVGMSDVAPSPSSPVASTPTVLASPLSGYGALSMMMMTYLFPPPSRGEERTRQLRRSLLSSLQWRHRRPHPRPPPLLPWSLSSTRSHYQPRWQRRWEGWRCW